MTRAHDDELVPDHTRDQRADRLTPSAGLRRTARQDEPDGVELHPVRQRRPRRVQTRQPDNRASRSEGR